MLVATAMVVAILSIALPAAGAPNDPAFDRQWASAVIGAERAWETGRGAGVTIAIIDTGVHLTHEDIAVAGKLVAGHDYIAGETAPQDENGHGTHVAGIAAAATGNGRGIAGVAPDARILPVRVLDRDGRCVGNCRVSDAIRWAADQGAGVINLSLGEVGQQVFGPSFGSALRYAWSKGSIPVVAAGNDFLLSSGYADHPALVVAATDRHDRKPDFSSGVGQAKWGLSAPGGGSSFDPIEDDILSTAFDPNAPNANDRYRYARGTSQAAPHVAGAAAILLSLGLDPQETVDRLLETAKDLGPAGRDATFGHGRLDIARAVEGYGTNGSVQANAQQPDGIATEPSQTGGEHELTTSESNSATRRTGASAATTRTEEEGSTVKGLTVVRRPGATSRPDDPVPDGPIPITVELDDFYPADDQSGTALRWASPLALLVVVAVVGIWTRRRRQRLKQQRASLGAGASRR